MCTTCGAGNRTQVLYKTTSALNHRVISPAQDLFLFMFVLYVSVCASAYRAQKRHRWEWSCGRLLATQWVLELNPGLLGEQQVLPGGSFPPVLLSLGAYVPGEAGILCLLGGIPGVQMSMLRQDSTCPSHYCSVHLSAQRKTRRALCCVLGDSLYSQDLKRGGKRTGSLRPAWDTQQIAGSLGSKRTKSISCLRAGKY